MDLHSGLPFWLVKSGLPYNYYPLERSIETQVAIMGGGISGALVAYHLSKAGVHCAVIDKRTIGLGSTSASTALLQYELDVPLVQLAKKIGEAGAARAYHICRTAIEELETIAADIQCPAYEKRDSLYFAAYKKHCSFLKDEYAARKRNGFSVDYLDDRAVMNTFSFHAPAAIYSHHGAQVNAYLFTHHLLQHCIGKGVPVFDRTPVVRIDHGEKRVKLHTGTGHTVTAKKLVYATGYESVQYIDEKIVDLHSTYAVISENMTVKQPFWKDDVLIWNTADPYLYMRSTTDGRIICGGRDEPFMNAKRRDALIKTKTKQLAKDFCKLFPAIPFKPEFSWTGVFGATRDGLPFIGPYKKLPNSLFALGFGGNGITFSQAAAVMLTGIITGGKNTDTGMFSFDRL